MTNLKLDKDRIERFFKGEGIDEDNEYIRKIFCDETINDELETLLIKQWYESTGEDTATEKNLDHILYRTHYDINTCFNKSGKKMTGFIKWIARIAAILLLPVSVYIGIHLYNKAETFGLTWTEISAPAWTRVKFTLPDSTIVWLNSKSSIKYKGNYLSKRMVILDGEAYFDVYNDKKSPLSVNIDKLTVIALGTKFNVASYYDENNLEIVLVEGELLVNDTGSGRMVQMVPDELITYNKERDKFNSEYVQTQAYTSWTEGKLVFRNDPIDIIARRLGRWYNVDVDIKGNNFDNVRLRATFVDENLEEVLYYLKLSLLIDYKIIEGGLIEGNSYSKKKVEITLE